MRARDRITRAGARTPWAERRVRSNGGDCQRARLDSEPGDRVPDLADTKGGCKPYRAEGMPGAGLTEARQGKAPSEKPALQPYWGKPAVRNERGGGGDVGIIRSPVRATTLPDKSLCPDLVRAPGAVKARRYSQHLTAAILGRCTRSQDCCGKNRLPRCSPGLPFGPVPVWRCPCA